MSSKLFDNAAKVDNVTTTTNGMTAFNSSLSAVLDLFQDGFSYRRNPKAVEEAVRKAALENKELTLKCLFYIRDIHEGQGEREVFRHGMRTLLSLYPEYARNIVHIPAGTDDKPFGRWDDLVALLGVSKEIDAQIFDVISTQLSTDMLNVMNGEPQKVSLLAKWLPSCNTSSKKTRELSVKVRNGIGITSEKQYRQQLSFLRKVIDIVETKLSNKDYTFDYSKIPSYAAGKYRKAFLRNDNARYVAYLQELNKVVRSAEPVMLKSAPKINTATLYPYDVTRPITKDMRCIKQTLRNGCYVDTHEYRGDENVALQADSQWRSLRNYFEGATGNHNWLAVVDTSGSMFNGWGHNIASIDVALSLGLYIAEHNTGIFKNQFISFSAKPTFQTIDDTWPLKEKLLHMISAPWGQNTDLEAVFDKVLEIAVKNKISADEMPEAILIISDMQFDHATRGADALKMIRTKYAEAGYKMPKIVFWNAATVVSSKPITYHRSGAILCGGCKPGMIEQILSAKNPEEFMVSVLNKDRYSIIK